jgi:hypothetical protein
MWEERKRGKCERKGKKEENKLKRETKCTIGQNLRGKRCKRRKLGLLGESKRSSFRGEGAVSLVFGLIDRPLIAQQIIFRKLLYRPA